MVLLQLGGKHYDEKELFNRLAIGDPCGFHNKFTNVAVVKRSNGYEFPKKTMILNNSN